LGQCEVILFLNSHSILVLEAVPSDPTASSAGSSTDTGADADVWFASWLGRFESISADPAWQALVSEWVQYEKLNPPAGVSVLILFSSLFDLLKVPIISQHRGCPPPHVQRRSSGGLSARNSPTSSRILINRRNLEPRGSSGGLQCNRRGAKASRW